jgi:DNA-binding protein H-NS
MFNEYDQQKERLEELIEKLREMKEARQGAEARAIAVTITELEKAYAYFCTFVMPRSI